MIKIFYWLIGCKDNGGIEWQRMEIFTYYVVNSRGQMLKMFASARGIATFQYVSIVKSEQCHPGFF